MYGTYRRRTCSQWMRNGPRGAQNANCRPRVPHLPGSGDTAGGRRQSPNAGQLNMSKTGKIPCSRLPRRGAPSATPPIREHAFSIICSATEPGAPCARGIPGVEREGIVALSTAPPPVAGEWAWRASCTMNCCNSQPNCTRLSRAGAWTLAAN